MTPCERPPCPDWLAEHWRQWGRDFAERREREPGYSFQWRTYGGTRVNRLLLPPLSAMTGNRCAYCDWFPMDAGTSETIDHFRPKHRYPEEVYSWPNLYLCCNRCQGKADASFDEQLLRPDVDDYSFERYFLFNYRSGEVEPNPQASELDRARAVFTIAHLRLNAGGLPAARMRELAKFRKLLRVDGDVELEDFAFRYLLLAELD